MDREVYVFFESHGAALKHYASTMHRRDMSISRPLEVTLKKLATGQLVAALANDDESFRGWAILLKLKGEKQ